MRLQATPDFFATVTPRPPCLEAVSRELVHRLRHHLVQQVEKARLHQLASITHYSQNLSTGVACIPISRKSNLETARAGCLQASQEISDCHLGQLRRPALEVKEECQPLLHRHDQRSMLTWNKIAMTFA